MGVYGYSNPCFWSPKLHVDQCDRINLTTATLSSFVIDVSAHNVFEGMNKAPIFVRWFPPGRSANVARAKVSCLLTSDGAQECNELPHRHPQSPAILPRTGKQSLQFPGLVLVTPSKDKIKVSSTVDGVTKRLGTFVCNF